VKLPYREGDWIAVPLRDSSGFGVGRIVRVAPGGRVLLGYFFGRRWRHEPTLSELSDLQPSGALVAWRFGDLRLVDRSWLVLGGADDWRREDWPMPVFARREPIGGRAWRVEYPDDNPNAVPRESPITEDEASQYPEDALLGAGVIESLLTKVLSTRGVI
jgi:Immunity protein 26